MDSRRSAAWTSLLVVLPLVYLLLGAFHVYAGKLHVDEGSYLYGARSVYRGLLPYRDFFYLQPPVHPYVYGLIQKWAGPGLLAGRFTSLAFGFLAFLIAAALAARLGGTEAMAIFMLFMALNPAQIYFFTITRLFALTGFFFSLACFLLADRRGRFIPRLFGLAMLGLAVGTRLTVLPALLPSLYFVLRSSSQPARKWRAAAAVAVCLLVPLAIYLPFYAAAPDNFFFNIIGLNLSLHSRAPLQSLAAKFRTLAHLARHNYFLLVCLAAVAINGVKARRGRLRGELSAQLHHPSTVATLWAIVLIVSLGHLGAKIFQETYQSFLNPVVMALAAAHLARLTAGIDSPSTLRMVRATIVAGCLLTALGHGRENLQFINGMTSTSLVADQAAFIKRHTGVSDALFSADSPLLAVEADREVLPGMAGSDYFPYWPTDRCRRYHVLNDELILEYIEKRAGAMLLVGDGSFTLTLPELEPVPLEKRERIMTAIAEKYRLVRTDPNAHVPGTNLYFYAPEQAAAPGSPTASNGGPGSVPPTIE
ncbi:hypothetical protein JW905_02220 [bacterium]|nr:hypothetical protein [candidate division CSSED10-310 bacterium]